MIQALLLVIFAKMAAGTDSDLQEKYLTMPAHEFMEYFNSQNYSWKMKMYTESRRLLPLDLTMNTCKLPVQEHEESVLNDVPVNFDSREKWSHCKTIKEIYDQGDCASCWAFASANSASDRTCIHTNIQVHLAEQDLKCLESDVCDEGADPCLALKFWRDEGLVSTNCKPYDVAKLKNGTCKHECIDENIKYPQDKHFAESVYHVKGDKQTIRAELFKNGPIQAGFMVYTDFLSYKEGIYVHQFGKLEQGHCVRVLGYGVENGIEYWLVANSWGPNWGMKGLFKIKINQKDLNFETAMCTGLPKN